jgi:hypothetical protein
LHLRTMFMPYLRDEDYLPKINSPGGSPGQRRAFQGQGNIGLDGIRKLRSSTSTLSRDQGRDRDRDSSDDGGDREEEEEEAKEEEDNGLDLTSIVAWSYFSRFYEGSAAGMPPCCRPKAVQVVPSMKPVSPEEREALEEKKRAAARPRSVSPIVASSSSSPGSGQGRGGGALTGGRRSLRGDSRSPSPTNKFGTRQGAVFGARRSSGRPEKLRRKVGAYSNSTRPGSADGRQRQGQGQGQFGHVPGMTNENVFNRQNADVGLLTSLRDLQDEMDKLAVN